MKMLNNKFARTLTAAVVVCGAAAMLTVGAFAAEASLDDPVIAGYLPPQEQMVQGDIALHSGDLQVGAVQGDIMLISADGEETAVMPDAEITMTGLFGKSILYTASQKDRVLTVAAPEDFTTLRLTVGQAQQLLDEGVSTLVLTTNKKSTTLNLTLLCEGYDENAKVTLRHCGSNARLTINGRSRRDLLIGR